MKNFYFTLLFVSYSLFISAQEIGGTPVQGLIPIKRIASSIEKPSSTTSRINEMAKILPTAAITPTGNSAEVGITEGQLSVSLTGGASYAIPIAVPPGINGVLPQISLTYNSQGGNGLAGYGWNISGISTISRIPSTTFHDGTIDGVDFNSLDRFAFDGQRLVVKNGTNGIYGAEGTIYETESFSTVQITSYGVHSSGANYGPAYFIVQYPDGSKAYYGNSADSRSITDYAISYWENPQGVRISYIYNNTNNNLSIASINYGSLLTAAGINQVQFTYKTRQRTEQVYIGGQSIRNNTILSSIAVTANGIGFRNYILGHDVTSLGYERLTSLTEKSGDNSKSYNPTVFSYSNTPETINYGSVTSSLSVANIRSDNSATISGDFDGDGKMDFLLYPTTGADSKAKYWLFSDISSQTSLNLGWEHPVGKFDEIFPTSWLSWNNKLMPMQGWCVVQNNLATNITSFNNYSTGTTSPIYFQYEKSYQFPKFTLDYYYTCATAPNPYLQKNSKSPKNSTTQRLIDPAPTAPVHVVMEKDIPKNYISGDFNGDGLTDVVVIEKSITYDYHIDCVTYNQIYPGGKSYFVNLDRRLTNNYVNQSGYINSTSNSILKIGDFNGDGKSDIYVFDIGKVQVYSLNDSNQFVLLYQNTTTDVNIVLDKPILMGDYNGDGKSDFIIPKGQGYSEWYKFTSTGITFIKEVQDYSGFYYPASNYLNTFTIIPTDYNNDGKTDLLLARSSRNSANSSGNIGVTCYINKNDTFALTNNNPYSGNSGELADIDIYSLPIFLTSNQANRKLELAFINKDKIYYFNSAKDLNLERLLSTITTGNGVTESITYQPLDSHSKEGYNSIYTDSGYTEVYPNTDIIVAPTFQVVTKLEKQSASVYKKQLFSYYGAASNVNGLGFLGFRASMRTNWHDDMMPIISSISKFDVSLRGANTESYTVLGFQNATGSASPTNFISKSINTFNLVSGVYEAPLQANKVFKLKNTSSQQYNGLDNTSSEAATTYDTYNNPIQSTTLVKQASATQQTTITNVVYDNQPTASTYYIGRPTNKIQSVTVTGDMMDSEEQFVYANNLLTQIKKRGTGTTFITEDNTYDANGNITKKIITAPSLAPRVTNYEYDASGRFLTKSIDIEELATTFNYNFSNGLLNSETNPYGLTTSYTYDPWFKKTKTIDYLGKSMTIGYARSGVNTSITTAGDDGSATEEVFDDLGRKTKSGAKNINGVMTYSSVEYDIYSRTTKTSESYFSEPTQWNTSKYDEYGRVTEMKSFAGKTVSSSYSGLTTAVNDGFKTKTVTKNAIGNMVTMTDTPGGTINYTYFANSNLKTSDFGGSITSITQDGWGRKKTLTDPSAGTYTYSYNDFGETLSETTPNGTTNYTLDSFGKLTNKTIGGATSTSIVYNYDTTTKLPTTTVFTENGKVTTYTYGYDGYKRLNATIEAQPEVTFTKQLTFDAFGRTDLETSTALISGTSSSKTIKNTYKNGSPWQIIDNTSQQVLWQTNALNERGQLTGATLGNGINISNSYDNYGFLKTISHTFGTTNVMTLNTTFEPIRGNLTDRYTSLFDYKESFNYDNLDRLTTVLSDKVLFNITSFSPFSPTPTEGFETVGSSSVSANSSPTYNGKLNVIAYPYSGANAGVRKLISSTIPSGTLLNLSGGVNVTGGTIGPINVTIREFDINNQIVNIQIVTTTGFTGFQGTYTTVSANSKIYLYFETQSAVYLTFDVTNVKASTVVSEIQNYDDKGKITSNSVGVYNYATTTKPYQNTSVTLSASSLPYYQDRNLQEITYNAFKAPVSIKEQGKENIYFQYNALNSRATMYYGGTNTQIDKNLQPYRKYYSADGSMEVKYTLDGGAVEFVTYLGGDGYTAPIVLKSDGVTQNYFYLHRDYQGSILAITNATGGVVEKRFFDAWGSLTKYGNINGVTTPPSGLGGLVLFLDRGYTGHEHLLGVGLINMNGRLYDPKLHRFLQPDNYVQDPSNTQNYNRYGYCWNNPTKFTDPSGEWIWIVVGAFIGGVGNWIAHGAQFNARGLTAFGIGAAAGALAGIIGPAAFAAAGGGAAGAGGFIAGAVGGAAGASVSQMVLSVGNHVAFGDPLMSGKDFIKGVAFGAVLGGSFNGVAAIINGKTFISGTRIAVQPISIQPVGLVKTGGGEQSIKTDAKLPNTAQPSTAPTTQSNTTTKVTFTKNVDGNGFKVDGLGIKNYPPNNGAVQGTENLEYLQPGANIDRYGSLNGTYASPAGTPLELRSLPPSNSGILRSFEVLQPFPVQSSTIAPWYNQVGGGIQYKLPKNINWLLENGFLK